MTGSLGVRVDGRSDFRSRVAATMASLPGSFHPTGDRADIVAIEGDGNWTEQAADAIRSGARGILVADPEPQDARDLRARAERSGTAVLLDTRWAHNPAVAAVANEFFRHVTDEALLEADVVTSCSGGPVLADLPAQFALVRALSRPVATARVVAAGIHGYTVFGATAAGVRVKLVNVKTDALPASARLRYVGREGSIDLAIPDPATAQPARFTVTTSEGATVMPTIFESARRAGWRALHAAVIADLPLHDLDGFVEDAAVVAQLADDLEAFPAGTSHSN